MSRWPDARACGASVLAVIGALLALALIFAGPAMAENRGSDPLANIAPPAGRGGQAVVSEVPASHYALDTHVDAGITNPDGAIARIPHVLAEIVWTADRIVMTEVIRLLDFAVELDLVSGPDGALGPVAEAIEGLYAHTIGRQAFTVGILLAGLWALYHGLVRRDYAQTTARLCLSAVMVVCALFVVHRPEATIGAVAGWSSAYAAAVLSGFSGHGFDGAADGRQAVADRLQRQFVHDPWIVLNFGGPVVCTDSEAQPVGPSDPARSVCRPVERPNAARRGGYAERYLKWRPGSAERDAEFRAIAAGTTAVGDSAIVPSIGIGPIDTPGIGPATTPDQFGGVTLDDHDRPAVDIQQRGAGAERLVIALLVFLGSLGAILLIGALSLGMILTQVIALLVAAFAPVALVAGAVPGRGHALFSRWGMALAGALLAKAILALVLAVVLAVAGAVAHATAGLGFLMAFGLSGAFYWTIFLGRRRMWHALSAAAGVAVGPQNVRVRGRGLWAAERFASRAFGRGRSGGGRPGDGGGGPGPGAPPPDGPASILRPTGDRRPPGASGGSAQTAGAIAIAPARVGARVEHVGSASGTAGGDRAPVAQLSGDLARTAAIPYPAARRLERAAVIGDAFGPGQVAVTGASAVGVWTGHGRGGDLEMRLPAGPATEARMAALGLRRDGRGWVGPDGLRVAPADGGRDRGGETLPVRLSSGRQVVVTSPTDLAVDRLRRVVSHGEGDAVLDAARLVRVPHIDRRRLEASVQRQGLGGALTAADRLAGQLAAGRVPDPAALSEIAARLRRPSR